MVNSDVKVTPGIGKNVATYSVTEDAESKEIQRVGLNKSDGTEIGTSANPIITSPTGTMAVYFDKSNPSVNVGTPTITGITNSIATHILSTSGTLIVKLDPDSGVKNINSTVAVYFSPANPTVSIGGQSATLNVVLDPGHTLGAISGIGGSVGVYFDRGSPTVIASPTGTQAVYFDQSEPTVKVKPGGGTLLVAFDRANPNVTANAGTGTFNVQLDPGHTIGSISGIGTSVAMYFDRGSPTVIASPTGTFAVRFDDAGPLVSVISGQKGISANSGVTGVATQRVVHAVDVGTSVRIMNTSSSIGIYFDQANPNVLANAGTGTFNVILNPALTMGSISHIDNTVAVYFDRSAPAVSIPGSVAVYFDRGNPSVAATFAGTMAVYFDKSNPTVTANAGTGTLTIKTDPGYELGSIKGINTSVGIYFDRGSPSVTVANFSALAQTSSIFNASGSCSSAALGGNTVISPSANYSFKIFALQLTTTAQTGIYARFTNGASSTPTEYWRYALQAPTQGIAGANLAINPPGYLFATGTSTTLALLLDSGSLVHYSIAYIKETA